MPLVGHALVLFNEISQIIILQALRSRVFRFPDHAVRAESKPLVRRFVDEIDRAERFPRQVEVTDRYQFTVTIVFRLERRAGPGVKRRDEFIFVALLAEPIKRMVAVYLEDLLAKIELAEPDIDAGAFSHDTALAFPRIELLREQPYRYAPPALAAMGTKIIFAELPPSALQEQIKLAAVKSVRKKIFEPPHPVSDVRAGSKITQSWLL